MSDRAQELLERLWIASEEGEKANLTMGSTEPGVNELLRSGLAERVNGFSRLTPAGYFHAAQAVRRHRLAERLLSDVLATEETVLDEQACRLERALFNAWRRAFALCWDILTSALTANLSRAEMRDSVGQVISPLSELKPGPKGHTPACG